MFRCWPAAFGQHCTCGSDLLILVQTEIWSSLTKYSWLLEEELSLCDCIDGLKHSGCACDFFWDFPFPSYVHVAVRHQADAAETISLPQNAASLNEPSQRGVFC